MTSVARGTIAELAAHLRPSLLRLTRIIRNQRVDMSVTLTQIAAMGTLHKRGPMSAGELAACEKVQPPSMTRIVARLEEHGYLTRTPDPTDRRQVVVAASAEGRALLADDRRRKDKWLSQRLTTLDASERTALAAALPALEKLSRS